MSHGHEARTNIKRQTGTPHRSVDTRRLPLGQATALPLLSLSALPLRADRGDLMDSAMAAVRSSPRGWLPFTSRLNVQAPFSKDKSLFKRDLTLAR